MIEYLSFSLDLSSVKFFHFTMELLSVFIFAVPENIYFPVFAIFFFFNNTRILVFYSYTLAEQKKNYIHKEEIYIFKLKLLLFLYFRYYNKEKKKYISILWKLFEKLCDLFGGQYSQKQNKIEIP